MKQPMKRDRIKSFSDAELVELFRKTKKSDAFSEIMNRYGKRLYSYIAKMTGTPSDDVYQEVWMKIAASLDKYQESGKFVNYLFFIATNACYDYLRKIKKDNDNLYTPAKKDDENESDFIENISDSDSSTPLNNTLREEKVSMLQKGLSELPEEQREVVILRSEGFSFKEIAEMKNISINSALSRMRYAVEKLKAYRL